MYTLRYYRDFPTISHESEFLTKTEIEKFTHQIRIQHAWRGTVKDADLITTYRCPVTSLVWV